MPLGRGGAARVGRPAALDTMPDILLIGPETAAAAVENRLRACGLPPERGSLAAQPDASAASRDLVILVDPDERAAAWAEACAGAGPTAPVLLWLGPRRPPAGLASADVRWLAESADGPALLLEILEALRLSERRRLEALQDLREYVHFLDHDLRTPLTAALNALRILQERLDGRIGRPEREFIQLAQRNLERLRRTVDWSGDYLAGRLEAVRPRWQRTTVGELVSRALASCGEDGQRLGLEIAGGADRKAILADPELTATLLRQMIRVLRYHAAGAPISLRAGLGALERQGGGADAADAAEAAERTRVVLVLRTVGGTERVCRTGLALPQETAVAAEAELGRLLEFAVSGELVGRLQATARARWDGEGGALELALPLRPRLDGESSAIESVSGALPARFA